ncbi:MAG: MBOAT family protein, partial [Alphaproteobacteria bacterium]|nr:MBOAT family protein [Alphaproteobacteria bacterium]
AGLTFVIFGLLHGFYLIANHAWRTFAPASLRQDPKSPLALAAIVAAQVLLTYVAALVAQIFFRADTVADATALIAGMVGLHAGGALSGWAYNFGSEAQSILRVFAFFGMAWFLPNTQQIMAKFPAALGQIAANRYRLLEWMPDLKWAVSMGLAAGLAIASLTQHSEFLYFQF